MQISALISIRSYMNKLYFLVAFWAIPSFSFADFVNPVLAEQCETILEVYVNDDHILVQLEIGSGDYPWFSDIIPEQYYKEGFSEADKLSRWRHFMQHQLVLQAGGRVLLGKVQMVEERDWVPQTSSNLDTSTVKRKVIYAEVEYPFDGKKHQISMTPPIPRKEEAGQPNIGFVAYHKSMPVNDLYVIKQKETLQLNLEDPWYSHFTNPNIGRHHSSSFMSFLYVEPYEVRHEVLVRVKNLGGWMDLKYNLNDKIPVEDQEALKQKIAEMLSHHNLVTIDSVERKPILDRVNFVETNISGVQIIENPKPLPYVSAMVGVIFAYPDKGMPKEVKIHWDMFNDKIKLIPCTTIDPAGPWPHELQPSDSILTWTNFLKHYKMPNITEQKVDELKIHVPLFSILFFSMLIFMLYRHQWSLNALPRWRKFLFVLYLILGIISYPIGGNTTIPFLTKKNYTTPEAKALVLQLLKNTYRAFEFREESDVYDKLALCIDGPLLQQIYLQTRKSMVVENQGGIEAKVNEVVLSTIEKMPEKSMGLRYKCQWIAKGEVGHWGHKHNRVNQYEAIIDIRPVDGVWKMVSMEMIDEVRL